MDTRQSTRESADADVDAFDERGALVRREKEKRTKGKRGGVSRRSRTQHPHPDTSAFVGALTRYFGRATRDAAGEKRKVTEGAFASP